MHRYRALAYSGLVWLKDLGSYELFDEAHEALSADYFRQCEGLSESELPAFDEVYWANSRIEAEL